MFAILLYLGEQASLLRRCLTEYEMHPGPKISFQSLPRTEILTFALLQYFSPLDASLQACSFSSNSLCEGVGRVWWNSTRIMSSWWFPCHISLLVCKWRQGYSTKVYSKRKTLWNRLHNNVQASVLRLFLTSTSFSSSTLSILLSK